MNEGQLRTFTQNRDWFNDFFHGLRQIYDRASALLESSFALSAQGLYHNPRPILIPAMPRYYVLGMGGERGAIQLYTVMDLDMFRHPFFRKEPSFVVVAHADGSAYLEIGNYGELVMSAGPLEDESEHDGVLSGSIRGQTPFHAFQLGLEHFEEGRDLDRAINTVIVDRLKPLFPFPTSASEAAEQ